MRVGPSILSSLPNSAVSVESGDSASESCREEMQAEEVVEKSRDSAVLKVSSRDFTKHDKSCISSFIHSPRSHTTEEKQCFLCQSLPGRDKVTPKHLELVHTAV